ncbi:hypothetical protein [Pararhodobacter zhoushanensis]|uniref:Phage regulatory protein CII (CP76) n=1 Tax=Pararhodobacter zhoushanensis TaxID=2479545 RepID=A0ABT3H442_9RHOB|nr:hypothetical protein [Pararhodobacter zhoushanensis]MCW1934554.1 hypothetical protein [Pararhodobacter zhoushanensis]
MTRPSRPGTIQDAVRRAYVAVGGVENAAADMGLSLSSASYGTELREDRPGGLGVNYLDRLGRVDVAAALPVAQHFATLAGGVFQPIDWSGPIAGGVHALTREFSDVLQVHAEAHSSTSGDPADYTPEEARRQIREIDELVGAALRLRAAMVEKAGGAA